MVVARTVHNALTFRLNSHASLHGKRVGFGVVAQDLPTDHHGRHSVRQCP